MNEFCPVQPSGHADPDNTGQCIYCNVVLDADGQADRLLLNAAHTLRQVASRTGAMSALWDEIIEIESYLENHANVRVR